MANELGEELGFSLLAAMTGRDVQVPSGENFDYRLESAGAPPHAVEIYRLAQGEELATLSLWGKVIDLLKKELERRQVNGYIIVAPQQFALRKAEVAAVVEELADEIVAAIQAHPDEAKFTQGQWTIHHEDGVQGVKKWVNEIRRRPSSRAGSPHVLR